MPFKEQKALAENINGTDMNLIRTLLNDQNGWDGSDHGTNYTEMAGFIQAKANQM